jgi:hypothetical protein
MPTFGTHALIIGGSLSFVAALAHVACIVIGAPAYLFMGAGEKMARAAEAGKLEPTLTTLAVTGVLLVWTAYAFAGAGVIDHLPLTKFVLFAICSVYLGRALLFPLLKPAFPDNTQTFWLVSSGICFIVGLVHAYGIFSLWSEL